MTRYRFIFAHELQIGDAETHNVRTVAEFLPAKSSQFVKVRFSDDTIKTFDKADTIAVRSAAEVNR